MDAPIQLTYRTGLISDIDQILSVRNSVKENKLSDPNAITKSDCEHFMQNVGKTWVCEMSTIVIGFSMMDVIDNRVWALFIQPEYEKMGIGKELHFLMMDWYFSQKTENAWLGTTPNTRAEGFYKKLGWKHIGNYGTDEIKFEMTLKKWNEVK